MTDAEKSDPLSPSDEELMAALQDGEEAALGRLMDRWELGVKAFLLRLGVPPSDVEDVAQEAFVRLYEKRARYRRGLAFKSWLLTIAGNLGRNHRRWRVRRREDSIEDSLTPGAGRLDHADPTAISASVIVENVGTSMEIRSAVAGLPQRLRDAVVCVELEELSYSEAAQILGCSTKAVETRLYRAREILRGALRHLIS